MGWLDNRTITTQQYGRGRQAIQDTDPSTTVEDRGEQVRTSVEETPESVSTTVRNTATTTTTNVKAANTVTDTNNQHYAVNVKMRIPFHGKEPVTPAAP